MSGNSLESLRWLEISFQSVKNMESAFRKWQGTITRFTNLRTLIIGHRPSSSEEGKTFGSVNHSQIFPYSKLSHIYLSLQRSFEETLEILRSCSPSVRSARIDMLGFPDRDPKVTLPPTSFPFLDSLIINSRELKHAQALLDALATTQTPSLKSLSIAGQGTPDIDNYTSSSLSPFSHSLKHFLEHSGAAASLRTLHLSIVGILDSTFPASLMEALETTTAVEDLMIVTSQYGTFTDDYWHPYSVIRAVDFLRGLARNASFLPRLKNLHIVHLDHLRPDQTPWIGDLGNENGDGFGENEGSGQGTSSGGGESSAEELLLPKHSEWVNEFVAAVEVRRSQGHLRSVVLELESARKGRKSDMGLDVDRLRRLRDEQGLEIRVARTFFGEVHHEILGYGLGRTSPLYHHDLWMRIPGDVRNS